MKFVVWKVEDVLAVCNEKQLANLEGIGRMIGEMRREQGRNPDPKYYVVNEDEPYSEEVKEVIERHEGEEISL